MKRFSRSASRALLCHSCEDGNPVQRQPRRISALAGIARSLALVIVMLFAVPLSAQDTMPPAPYAYRQLSDPALEAKAQGLMETLRCLKCQSQSIADSDAPMAGDMRHQVRTRIAAGEQPEAIRAWLVERYGDYVSYAPQNKPIMWPLFAAPLVILLLAALLLRGRFRRGGAKETGE